MDKRGIKGGDQWRTQDEDEIITYTLDVTEVNYPSVGAVAAVGMTVWTCPDGTGYDTVCGPGGADVTAAVTAGALAVAGQVITLLTIQTLTKGTDYVVAVKYTKDGHTLENRFYIHCPDEEG